MQLAASGKVPDRRKQGDTAEYLPKEPGASTPLNFPLSPLLVTTIADSDRASSELSWNSSTLKPKRPRFKDVIEHDSLSTEVLCDGIEELE